MAIYKVKIRHRQLQGQMVAEDYAVEALSVTEAEAVLVASRHFFDYAVESVTKPRISGVLTGEGDNYYRCKGTLGIGEDKTAAEYYLIQAQDFDKAVERLKRQLGEGMLAIEFVQRTTIKGFAR